MRTFHLEIVTPDGLAFDGEAESLLVHTTEGDVEILCGHMDYIATVAVGRARVLAKGGESRLASCSGGFLSVTKDHVRLVAVTFEFAENIDEKRALAAKERAEKAVANAKDRRAKQIAEAKLARALNRIHIAKTK
ncbi:MAG: ATP synthase F1 subunit epsilon [Clostridia bacterium]|nr:ATP synthase F1 subunit epsilon [Clostridia bacterium]